MGTPGRRRVTGELGAAAGPEQQRPGVGVGEFGRGLRVQPGQDATAHVARRVEAEAEALGDVVAVQEGFVAAQRGETFWSAVPAG